MEKFAPPNFVAVMLIVLSFCLLDDLLHDMAQESQLHPNVSKFGTMMDSWNACASDLLRSAAGDSDSLVDLISYHYYNYAWHSISFIHASESCEFVFM